jgi:hypothetical protein
MKLGLWALALSLAWKAWAVSPHADTKGRPPAAPPAYFWGQTFTFEFGETKPPYFTVFPGGKDRLGADVSSHLGTLKWARGKSKLYPAEDQKPGLIAVLRSLSFLPDESGKSYDAVFEGEFNAIRIHVKKEEMESLLAGKPTKLTFRSQTTKGFGVRYRVEATTGLQVRLDGKRLVVDEAEGNCTITHISLTGKESPFRSEPADVPTPIVGRPGAAKGLPVLD